MNKFRNNEIINNNNKKNNNESNNKIININNHNFININEINENLINDFDLFKKEIELKYYSKYGGFTNILGVEFVNFNRNNIKLIVNNSKKISLIYKFYLKKGENIIKLIIEKDIINLSYMFYG